MIPTNVYPNNPSTSLPWVMAGPLRVTAGGTYGGSSPTDSAGYASSKQTIFGGGADTVGTRYVNLKFIPYNILPPARRFDFSGSNFVSEIRLGGTLSVQSLMQFWG